MGSRVSLKAGARVRVCGDVESTAVKVQAGTQGKLLLLCECFSFPYSRSQPSAVIDSLTIFPPIVAHGQLELRSC